MSILDSGTGSFNTRTGMLSRMNGCPSPGDLHSKERSTLEHGASKHVIADKFRPAIPAASQHIDQYPCPVFPGGRIIR